MTTHAPVETASARVMGLEIELGVRGPSGRLYEDMGRLIIEQSVFRAAEIPAHLQYSRGPNDSIAAYPEAWLGNGARLYVDYYEEANIEQLEYCTPEVLGPRHLVAAKRAGEVVVRKLVENSSIPEALVHAATGITSEEGVTTTSGLHFNYMVAEHIDNPTVKEILETHLATQIFAWGGGIGEKGYVLSLKGQAIGKPITGDKSYASTENLKPMAVMYPPTTQHSVHMSMNSVRLEDRTKDNTTDWGIFMGAATTSVLLRVVENRGLLKFRDLNLRLQALRLADPVGTIRQASSDLSLQQQYTLKDGRSLTAIQIQTQMAQVAYEFAQRVRLPEDEVQAIQEWLAICKDLEYVAQTGKVERVADRIGWAMRLVGLRSSLKRTDNQSIVPSNRAALRYMMAWDQVAPRAGVRGIVERKIGRQIVTEAEIEAAVSEAPSGRGRLRGRHIAHPLPGLAVNYVSWGRVRQYDSDPLDNNRFADCCLGPHDTHHTCNVRTRW